MAEVDRSPGMVRLVYFLHHNARHQPNGPSQPPTEFDDLNWREVYEQFFEVLGEGRSFNIFKNSAEGLRKGNIRDYLENGIAFLARYEPMLKTWILQSREQQWADLQQYRCV